MSNKLHAIILAAGKGTRMKSHLPKVLHKIAGKPMVQHVIDTSNKIGADKITLIYGHKGEMLKSSIKQDNLVWVEQKEQLGTGHAVIQGIGNIEDNERVVILFGDVPFIDVKSLKQIINGEEFNLLTLNLDDPSGYGRIVRVNSEVAAIVEHKDTSGEEKLIQEVNTGFMALNGNILKKYLAKLDNNNVQQEYYLTDLVKLAKQDGISVFATVTDNEINVAGVNSRAQLVRLEKAYYQRSAEELLANGVTVIDPDRIDIRGELSVGQDTILDVNLITEGKVRIGSNCTIEANVILRDCKIGDNCHIKANSIIEKSSLANQVSVGPFARIRPDTELADKVQIGNFVEMKKVKMGEGSKAGHLAYLGDAQIGSNVNVGAGTITCNYDGANKHQTVLGDDVFVGSDTQLVAPVSIGKGVTIAAGTTVTKDVEPDTLVISRTKQKSIENWQRPVKDNNSVKEIGSVKEIK